MRELRRIEVKKILANPYQPRNYFDEKGIEELANSIKENGLIQPISVRERLGHYEIIVGERRFRAIQKLGYETIEAYVLDEDESGSMNKALIENVQRENLSAIEEARAYLKIMQFQNITQSELAKQMGKSQSGVANKIRLLQLHSNVQKAVEEKRISERHARALLPLTDEMQNKVLESIEKESLSVDKTEKKVKALTSEKKKKPVSKGYSRNVQIAVNTLKQAITMVEKSGIHVDYTLDEKEEVVTMKIHIKK